MWWIQYHSSRIPIIRISSLTNLQDPCRRGVVPDDARALRRACTSAKIIVLNVPPASTPFTHRGVSSKLTDEMVGSLRLLNSLELISRALVQIQGLSFFWVASRATSIYIVKNIKFMHFWWNWWISPRINRKFRHFWIFYRRRSASRMMSIERYGCVTPPIY